jgi:hypothetical protein
MRARQVSLLLQVTVVKADSRLSLLNQHAGLVNGYSKKLDKLLKVLFSMRQARRHILKIQLLDTVSFEDRGLLKHDALLNS